MCNARAERNVALMEHVRLPAAVAEGIVETVRWRAAKPASRVLPMRDANQDLSAIQEPQPAQRRSAAMAVLNRKNTVMPLSQSLQVDQHGSVITPAAHSLVPVAMEQRNWESSAKQGRRIARAPAPLIAAKFSAQGIRVDSWGSITTCRHGGMEWIRQRSRVLRILGPIPSSGSRTHTSKKRRKKDLPSRLQHPSMGAMTDSPVTLHITVPSGLQPSRWRRPASSPTPGARAMMHGSSSMASS